MAKPYTYPDIIDYAYTISISDLKKQEYFKGYKSGVIAWKARSIQLIVDIRDQNNMYAKIFFFDDGETIDYKISLVQVKSNLGRGFRWYFVCPSTGKRCIKLYNLAGSKYFLHREAYKGALYERQTESKKDRFLMSFMLVTVQNEKKLREEFLFKKYSKTYYNNQPTKKLKKIFKLRERMINTDITQFFNS